MSLIADALKAAQRDPGKDSRGTRQATARRVLAGPSTAPVSAMSLRQIPPHLRVAGAVFGVAILAAMGVVAVAPREVVVPVAMASSLRAPAEELPQAGPAQSDGISTAVDPSVTSIDAPAQPDEEQGSPEGRTLVDRFSTVGRVEAARRPQAVLEPSPTGEASEAATSAEASEARAFDLATARAATETAIPTRNQGPSPAEPAFQLRVSEGGVRPTALLFEQAVSAQRRRDFANAVLLYARVIEGEPTNSEAHNNLGASYQALGELARARDAFRQAVALQPRYAAAWSNLGAVLGTLGEEAEAQVALAEAIRLDSGNVGAKVNLALQYQRQGLLIEARRLLEEALRASPQMPEAHYALGRLLEQQNDTAGAVRHYRLFLTTAKGRFTPQEAAVRQRIQQLGG